MHRPRAPLDAAAGDFNPWTASRARSVRGSPASWVARSTAAGQALSGMVDALSTALPAGALPILGIALLVLVLWRVIRR